jgi:hypothetical protein
VRRSKHTYSKSRGTALEKALIDSPLTRCDLAILHRLDVCPVIAQCRPLIDFYNSRLLLPKTSCEVTKVGYFIVFEFSDFSIQPKISIIFLFLTSIMITAEGQ